MKKLLIVGTGDYAEMVFFYLKERYNIIGFSEELKFRVKDTFKGLPIFNLEDITGKFSNSEVKIFIAIGPNKVNTVRERIYTKMKTLNYTCIKFIHPKASVWDNDAIGDNSFIFPNAVVEPFAVVGNNCVLWTGAVLCHHSKLMDHNFMAPNSSVSGRTIIHKNCFLGINSTVRDNIIVEENCIIGAGSVIKKSTVKNGVYSSKGTSLYNLKSISTKV